MADLPRRLLPNIYISQLGTMCVRDALISRQCHAQHDGSPLSERAAAGAARAVPPAGQVDAVSPLVSAATAVAEHPAWFAELRSRSRPPPPSRSAFLEASTART